MLVQGEWKTEGRLQDEDGRFVRSGTSFRDRVRADGSSGFPAEVGRYHLYVAWACPWAHRTAIMRRLKGLEAAISLSSVGPFMDENGWTFSDGFTDSLFGAEHLGDIYTKADPDYTGHVTTPVLWDTEQQTIVNNESREIICMLDTEFGEHAATGADFYPHDRDWLSV